MRALCPLPIREDWTPTYLRARHDANRDFAFNYEDKQGAPSSDGRRYHSAVDWFAPGSTWVISPAAGRVHRVSLSRGNTGQVFGGVVEILEPDGTTWVMRHVEPGVTPGQTVHAGRIVGSVTSWRDGGPHLHLEIWRTPTGGYRHENMIDPREVKWVTASTFEVEPPALPHDGTLRLTITNAVGGDFVETRRYAGWDECKGPLRWIAKNGLKPDTKAAIAWRSNVWRGPVAVTGVARHLVRKFLS